MESLGDVSAPCGTFEEGPSFCLVVGAMTSGSGDVRLELREAAEDGRVDLPIPNSALDEKGTQRDDAGQTKRCRDSGGSLRWESRSQ